MSLSHFLATLRARWRLVALVFGLMTAAVAVASLLQPRSYTATSSVVVDFRPDPLAPQPLGGLAATGWLATQVGVLRSEAVARRVVERLQLEQHAGYRERWQQDTAGEVPMLPWLLADLAEHLEVRPAAEGGVIAIDFRSLEPVLAAEVANAFMQSYLDVAGALRVDPARQYSSFFEGRADAARRSLEQAQSRLSAFQEANGIVVAEERLDLETARLNQLSAQLTALQSVVSESASRQVQAQGARADQLQVVIDSPLVNQLRADIGRAESQLQQLDLRLGDNHPQVQEAQAQLRALRAKLERETRQVAGSVGVAADIDRGREASLRAAVDEQRQRVLRLKAVRDEGLVLQREVERSQRQYEGLQQRQTQASLESQSPQGNVHVLARAEVPIQPSSPRLLLNLVLGMLLSGVAAAGSAVALELRDRRIRTADGLAEDLGLRWLGELPRAVRAPALPALQGVAGVVGVVGGPVRAVPPGAGTFASSKWPIARLHGAGTSVVQPGLPLPGSRAEAAGRWSALPTPAAAIGQILTSLGSLDADEVQAIVERQRATGERFGEAAVALGHASHEDILFALGLQFRYPYTVDERAALSAELVLLNEPFGARAESFRSLRSQLMLPRDGERGGPGVLAIISAQRGEGRSYCAANLAVALAQRGGRTLLVDADLRRPRLHEVFCVDNASGLSNVLAGRDDLGAVRPVTGVPDLFVLPAGAPAPNPLELVERDAFPALIDGLRGRFSHVVVDTPAASHGADAAVIAVACGAALLVTRRDASRAEATQSLLAALQGCPLRSAGVVFNRF